MAAVKPLPGRDEGTTTTTGPASPTGAAVLATTTDVATQKRKRRRTEKASIDLDDLVGEDEVISTMMTQPQIVGVLRKLHDVLDMNVPGDIVELGCNVGTTSVFIRRLLDLHPAAAGRRFHVYDSWQGLPDRHPRDASITARKFHAGYCKTGVKMFEKVFSTFGLELPVVHSGWFAEIPADEYPNPIAFAFLDGDFYSSITDSFEAIYHKVSPGGMIVVDDCGWDVLPGVQRACDDFLRDKAETLTLVDFPDAVGHGGSTCAAYFTKA